MHTELRHITTPVYVYCQIRSCTQFRDRSVAISMRRGKPRNARRQSRIDQQHSPTIRRCMLLIGLKDPQANRTPPAVDAIRLPEWFCWLPGRSEEDPPEI